MEIHLPMNPKIGKTFPLLCRTKPKSYRLKTISCRANTNLAMQRGNTNFYEVLSLSSENVGFDEIKRAYKALALRYHPDVCPPSTREESTVLFVELRKAYETLSDPVLRRIHDFELGLVDSLGISGVERVCLGEKRSSFPKEVWERQLCGLKKRSRDRMERKRD